MNIASVGDYSFGLKLLEKLDDYHIEPSGKKRQKFLVECCNCKNNFKIVGLYFYRVGTKCKICRYNKSSLISVGSKYDNLTVIGFTNETTSGKKEAICKCICGTEVIRRPELLSRINITNNCGCLKRGNYKGIGELSQTKFMKFKNNAKSKNRKFELTKEYLWSLFLKQNRQCVYTKMDLYFGKLSKDKSTASLDRIDSTLDYIEGNVQWVHKDINLMKLNFSHNEFIKLCKQVYQNCTDINNNSFILSDTLFYKIKKSAYDRNIEFNVSKEHLQYLINIQNFKCALTNQNIYFGIKTTDKSTASLDRIDSSIGYIEGNLQWVYRKINIMKNNLNQNYFINLCKLVSENNI